ncbi:hypothetical protein BDR07DRAFT_1372229 [Suillus spraguei]|nr:hypothetical protein BDR07DRAFT_1372229 [Suillus spraguei]
MPIISDDPSWWPTINASITSSYFIGSWRWPPPLQCGTIGVELVWRQRWSLMTAMYLYLRYIGLVYAVIGILSQVPTISLTDTGCLAYFMTLNWITFVSTVMLNIIMITRLYAMYRRSRKVLITLVIIFLAISIVNGTISGITTKNSSAVVLILSGSYVCSPSFAGVGVLLVDITWMIGIAWEVLALCLTVWIAVKHVRELRQSGGGTLGNLFKALIKTHVIYFTRSVIYLQRSQRYHPYSLETQIYLGFSQIFAVVQMVVLGPRLILSVREFNAALMVDTDLDGGTGMISVAFREHVHITTGDGV